MSDAEFTAPETSLADDLSSALDAAVADDAAPAQLPPVEAQDAPVEAAAAESSKERDGRGRFVKGDPDKPAPVVEGDAKPAEVAEVKAEVKPDEPAQNLAAPPSTWTAKAKAEWAALPESIRAEVKKREADVAKGFEQYSAKARLADEMAKEIAPYQQLIDRQGGTPTTVIRSLLATAAQLHSGTPQDRGRLVMQIAQQYGADITPYVAGMQPQQQPAGDASGLNPQQLQGYVQQLVAPYEQRLQQYEQQVLTAQQQREQEQQSQLQAVITAFQSETLPDGSPKHTYFDNVRTVMSGLLNSGAAQSLEQAYEMACRADPEVSAAIQSEQTRKAQATQLEEARRKAEDAKRASAANVRGQGGIGMADTSKLTLRDELASHFDRSAA